MNPPLTRRTEPLVLLTYAGNKRQPYGNQIAKKQKGQFIELA
jgi:hypothetical protein